jgi:hypothetical protein
MHMTLPRAFDAAERGCMRKRRAAARTKKLPRQVNIEHRPPLLCCHFEGRRVLLDSGIGDKNIDPTEDVDKLSKHPKHVLFLRNVGL